MTPDISVIVLTYNQEKTISKAIESILQQTDAPAYEIIIGDDCSVDNTRAICMEYQDKYPEIIRIMPASPNKGLVDNYFYCLSQSRGRFIADCSGDDYWIDKMKLHREYDAIIANPDVSLVYSGIEGRPVICTEKKIGIDLLTTLLNSTVVPEVVLSASLYRKSALLGYIDKIREFNYDCEDFPIYEVLLSGADAIALEGAVLHYNVDDKSITRPGNPDALARMTISSLKMRYEIAIRSGIDTKAIGDYTDNAVSHIAAILLQCPGSSYLKDFDSLRRMGIKMTKKARIYRTLFSVGCIWKISKKIRNTLRPCPEGL